LPLAEATRVKNFPYAAIEECVINALYHRSYEEREPVEVRISPDELIVLSYPGPDRSVRLAQLRAGRAVPRRYRNRRIGEFLKELELTEGRSTGVPKIFRAMSQNGSPPPEFEFDEDYSYFMVRLPVHPEARAASAAAAKGTGDVGTESALSRHQVEILRRCTEDTAIGDLMSIAGRADRTKFRNQILRPLLRAKLLKMTIPEKPSLLRDVPLSPLSPCRAILAEQWLYALPPWLWSACRSWMIPCHGDWWASSAVAIC
jgi:ATP-dependent DNA helicase RecG